MNCKTCDRFLQERIAIGEENTRLKRRIAKLEDALNEFLQTRDEVRELYRHCELTEKKIREAINAK